jgi:hypothetical protein
VCIHRFFPYYYDEDNPLYEGRFEIEEFIGELAFYVGSSYKLYISCFKGNEYDMSIQCSTGNYSKIANMVSSLSIIFIIIILLL